MGFSYDDPIHETPTRTPTHQDLPIQINRSAYSQPSVTSTPQRRGLPSTTRGFLEGGLYTPGTPKMNEYARRTADRSAYYSGFPSPRTPRGAEDYDSYDYSSSNSSSVTADQYGYQNGNPAQVQGNQQAQVQQGGTGVPNLFSSPQKAQQGGFIGKLLTPVKKIAQQVFSPRSTAKSGSMISGAGVQQQQQQQQQLQGGAVNGANASKSSADDKKNADKKKPVKKERSHIPTEELPWKDKNWKPKDSGEVKPWQRKVFF